MAAFLKPYNQLAKYPFGRWLFSKGVCWRAPYFASIKPYVVDYRAGYIEVRIPDRRSVHNHIRSVHAIALCNLAEVCGALTMDSQTPPHLSWIPAGMTVKYLKRAQGTITGKCSLNAADVKEGKVVTHIDAFDPQGTLVFIADITFHISPARATADNTGK